MSPNANVKLDPVVSALIAARRSQGCTQENLAIRSGISRRSIAAIETGGDCTLSTLRALAEALDMRLTAHDSQYQFPSSVGREPGQDDRPRMPTLDDVTDENRAARFGGTGPGGCQDADDAPSQHSSSMRPRSGA